MHASLFKDWTEMRRALVDLERRWRLALAAHSKEAEVLAAERAAMQRRCDDTLARAMEAFRTKPRA